MRFFSTKNIALTGLFTALCVIANIFSINIIPPIFILSFLQTICFISGLFLNPILAFFVGFTGDALGFILSNSLGGVYNPLIGISSGLLAFIPSIIMYVYNKTCIIKTRVKTFLVILLSFVVSLIICTTFINTFALWVVYAKGKKTFVAYLLARLPFQFLTCLSNFALSYGLFLAFNKSTFLKNQFYIKDSKDIEKQVNK